MGNSVSSYYQGDNEPKVLEHPTSSDSHELVLLDEENALCDSSLSDSLGSDDYFLVRKSKKKEDEEDDGWVLVQCSSDSSSGEQKKCTVNIVDAHEQSWWTTLTSSLNSYISQDYSSKDITSSALNNEFATEREAELQKQIEDLQTQIKILNLKWDHILSTQQEPIVTQVIRVAPNHSILPNSTDIPYVIQNTISNPQPMCTVQQVETATESISPTIKPSLIPTIPDTPPIDNLSENIPASTPIQNIPTAPPLPNTIPPPPLSKDIPPPPPIGNLSSKKPVISAVPKTLSKAKIETELKVLIAASDLSKHSHGAAFNNFMKTFDMEGGLQILKKMIDHYYFLIKKYPLDPARCFQTMVRWEKDLFSKIDKNEASKLRKKKWYEIATLEKEEEITKQIAKIIDMIELQKKKEEERKKQELIGAQQNSVIDELRNIHKAQEEKDSMKNAEKELENLKSATIDISQSQLFLSFCE